jgi:hypothetical protein
MEKSRLSDEPLKIFSIVELKGDRVFGRSNNSPIAQTSKNRWSALCRGSGGGGSSGVAVGDRSIEGNLINI